MKIQHFWHQTGEWASIRAWASNKDFKVPIFSRPQNIIPICSQRVCTWKKYICLIVKSRFVCSQPLYQMELYSKFGKPIIFCVVPCNHFQIHCVLVP